MKMITAIVQSAFISKAGVKYSVGQSDSFDEVTFKTLQRHGVLRPASDDEIKSIIANMEVNPEPKKKGKKK